MSSHIRNWLTELRVAEPELARPVGEAVLAMLDAGGVLGPPLRVPLESVFRSPEDPREALDRSSQRAHALEGGHEDLADQARRREAVRKQLSECAASSTS